MAGADAELRDKLRAAFEEVDTDNSGSISHSELKTALIKSGFKPSDEDVHVGESSVRCYTLINESLNGYGESPSNGFRWKVGIEWIFICAKATHSIWTF